jgi:GNAT superfamily N-acetyltransferase
LKNPTVNIVHLRFHPLTRNRWPDLEALFGERGACGGCWCMTWRLTRTQFGKQKGDGNKKAFKKIVAAGPAPGVIAYAGKQPIGWCAVAPRESYPVLDRSRVLAKIDDQAVWSVSCFFVAKPYRGQGVTVALLEAAAKYVRSCGGKVMEGYPHDLGQSTLPGPFVWTGLLPAFKRAGFKEVARRSPKRPIVRLKLAARASKPRA